MKKKYHRHISNNQKNLIAIVISMVFIGLILVVVRASSNTASVQPENGALAGGASECLDLRASGGKCVQFGAGSGSVVQVSQLPINLGNYAEDYGPYNSTIFCSDQLTSAFDPAINARRQYFTFGDVHREPMITTRVLPNGAWQTPVSLKAVLLNQNMINDGHNCLVSAVDSEGYIHVMGNTHAIPLKMARSVNPFSIASFVNVPVMVDSAPAPTGTEDRTSYPSFFKTNDGTLMLAYRNGYQTDDHGRWYLNRWDPTSGSPGHWVRVANITDDANSYSFYPWRITVDRSATASKGRIHWFGTWRKDPGSDNEDLVDFYSDDNGVSWHQYGNPSPMTLPIKHGDGSYILNTSLTGPGNRFILNSGGLDIDSQGHPHALVHMSSQAGTFIPRLHHVWYDGSAWRIHPLDVLGAKPRSSVFSDNAGNTWGFISPGDGTKMSVINLTPGSPGFETTNFPLTKDLNYGSGQVAIFDSTLLNSQNKLSFMFSQLAGQDPSTQPDANYQQPGYIETFSIDQLSGIQAGAVIPHLESKTIQTVTAKTITGTTLQKLVSTATVTSTRPLYIKLTATAHVAVSGTTLRLKAVKTTSTGDFSFGQLDFTSTTPTTASTPWLPAQRSGNYSGILSGAAQMANGSNSATIDSYKIEVSEFVY